jgi:hypothetical protein
MGLQVQDGGIVSMIYLADADHVDDVVKQIITGIKAAAHDLKEQVKQDESGLVVVKGGIPDGLSSQLTEGRQLNGSRRKG